MGKINFKFTVGHSLASLCADYNLGAQEIIRGVIESDIQVYLLGVELQPWASSRGISDSEWVRVEDRSALKVFAYSGNAGGNFSHFKKGLSENGIQIERSKYPYFYLFWNKAYISQEETQKLHTWLIQRVVGSQVRSTVIENSQSVEVRPEHVVSLKNKAAAKKSDGRPPNIWAPIHQEILSVAGDTWRSGKVSGACKKASGVNATRFSKWLLNNREKLGLPEKLPGQKKMAALISKNSHLFPIGK